MCAASCRSVLPDGLNPILDLPLTWVRLERDHRVDEKLQGAIQLVDGALVPRERLAVADALWAWLRLGPATRTRSGTAGMTSTHACLFR